MRATKDPNGFAEAVYQQFGYVEWRTLDPFALMDRGWEWTRGDMERAFALLISTHRVECRPDGLTTCRWIEPNYSAQTF